jgi:hypothetical protein
MIKKNEPNNADELKKTRVRSIDRWHRGGKTRDNGCARGKGPSRAYLKKSGWVGDLQKVKQ